MLYEAMREILLDSGSLGGPLPNLYMAAAAQTRRRARAWTWLSCQRAAGHLSRCSGRGRGRALGWRGPGGTAPHDGGVAWYRTRVQFQVRAAGDMAGAN